MRIKTDEFPVVDEDGQRYVLEVYTEMNYEGDKDFRGYIPGIKHVYTSDGRECNRNNDGTFQIIGCDFKLKRVLY